MKDMPTIEDFDVFAQSKICSDFKVTIKNLDSISRDMKYRFNEKITNEDLTDLWQATLNTGIESGCILPPANECSIKYPFKMGEKGDKLMPCGGNAPKDGEKATRAQSVFYVDPEKLENSDDAFERQEKKIAKYIAKTYTEIGLTG